MQDHKSRRWPCSLKSVLALLISTAAAGVLASALGAMQPRTGAAVWAILDKAVRSGCAGFIAGAVQVLAFMWLRTVMNYQYKFGGTLREVLKKLYKEGGIARLYQGLLPWAILQAPLSRFGAVAANDFVVGVSSILLPEVPMSVSTLVGSMGGALWRIVITPIDTCKTILQTDGEQGFTLLKEKIRKHSIFVLWSGWEGNYVASLAGNYPWFVTLNLLEGQIPNPQGPLLKLVRMAICGAVASSVSDIVSNSIRVVKTKKQTHADGSAGYTQATREVYDEGGAYGLCCRGLETRIYTNILQGTFFTVLWKYFST